MVTQADAKTRKVSASIKALEIAEEKEAVAQYGSTDSGASLGDILGAALNKAKGGEPTRSRRPTRMPAAKPKRKRKPRLGAESEARRPSPRPPPRVSETAFGPSDLHFCARASARTA